MEYQARRLRKIRNRRDFFEALRVLLDPLDPSAVADYVKSLGLGEEFPIETDAHRLAQRQKQIDIGKNTEQYEAYMEWQRNPDANAPFIPVPNKYEVRSKRSWDGIVREWRRRLHEWYNESYIFIPTQYRCTVCKDLAGFREEYGILLFCGEDCQRKFHSLTHP